MLELNRLRKEKTWPFSQESHEPKAQCLWQKCDLTRWGPASSHWPVCTGPHTVKCDDSRTCCISVLRRATISSDHTRSLASFSTGGSVCRRLNSPFEPTAGGEFGVSVSAVGLFSDFNVLGLRHLSQRLFNTQGGETRSRIMSPTLCHELPHLPQTLTINTKNLLQQQWRCEKCHK